MRVTLSKTKLMVGGERHNSKKPVEKWPCAVCGKGVGSDSMQCTNCQWWVLKRCSDIKGSLCKASWSFLCCVCLCHTASEAKWNVDIGDGSSV